MPPPLSPARQRVADEARRARRRRSLGDWGTVAAIIVGVGVFGWFAFDLGRPHLGVEQPFEGGVQQHLPDGSVLPQRNRPPSSGPHYAARASYGVSTAPIPPGNWIHVLEHGGIVVLFKCATDEECVQRAEEVRTGVYDQARAGAFGERKLTATPYQEMDAPITVVAWGRILPLDTLDPEQVLAFYDRYLDRGPERAA
jgi:hypothetical protein